MDAKTADLISQEIDAWFNETFPASPLSRDSTLWNFVFDARIKLQERIRGMAEPGKPGKA